MPEHVGFDWALQPGATSQGGQPLADRVIGHGPTDRGVEQVDEHEVALVRRTARAPLDQIVVIAGQDLGAHRHVVIATLGVRTVGVGVPIHDMQMRALDRAPQRPGRRGEMQIATPQSQRFADTHPAEPQHHDQQAVPPAATRPQQGVDLGCAHRTRAWPPAAALHVAGPRPIPHARPFRTQLGRQVAIVADLIQQRQHHRVDRAAGHRMLVKLADRGQHMVDPTGATHLALARPRPLHRGRPQHRHEQAQRACTADKIATAPSAPAQEQRQVPGVGLGRALGPVTAQTKMTQEGVSNRDETPVIIDDRPVRQRRRHLDPQRTHLGRVARSHPCTSCTVSRGCDKKAEQQFATRHHATRFAPQKSVRARGRWW